MHLPEINRLLRAVLAAASTALLVSSCGGGVEPLDTMEQAGLQPAQYTETGASQPAHVNANSFTLKPGEEFKGFNPEIWNDRKAWYECDCGRHPQPRPAKKMEWNPI